MDKEIPSSLERPEIKLQNGALELTLTLVILVLISIFQVRFKDADISDAFVSGWGLRAQKECTTIDKVHSEQDKKKTYLESL